MNEASRLQPLRFFNLFRLLIASLFLVAGAQLNLGTSAPTLFFVLAVLYFGGVLLLGFPDAIRYFGFERLITIQVVLDIFFLSSVVWLSNGYRSGMPVMMMVYLGAAGLVAQGRMTLFYAALASLMLLFENIWREYAYQSSTEFIRVGMTCVAFFAISYISQLLARRAVRSESLAASRAQALRMQQAVNEKIIKDMHDGVIVMSAEGRVRQANPRASDLLGQRLSAGARVPALSPVFEQYALCSGAEYSVLERLGHHHQLLRCRVVGGVGGGISEGDLLVYLTDFEEVQQHAQQIKLAALGRLTASMAHEIRNPLSAVTQAADLLVEENRRDLRIRLIEIINSNAKRIERMVKDVLALGRRDQSMREMLPLKVIVNEMVDELTLTSSRELFDIDIAADVQMEIDRIHLHQILTNLIANARRYCSGQIGAIRIFTELAGEQQVKLHVLDDGDGIAVDVAAQLFEPFFTTDAKGTGLGLYIARELAETNNAKLEFMGNTPGAHFVLTAGRAV